MNEQTNTEAVKPLLQRLSNAGFFMTGTTAREAHDELVRLQAECDALRLAAATATATAAGAPDWTPVGPTTMPPPGKDVLCKRSNGRPPIVAGWFKNAFYTFDNDSRPVDHITHWMLLPQGSQAPLLTARA
jgi:hypothetical protein